MNKETKRQVIGLYKGKMDKELKRFFSTSEKQRATMEYEILANGKRKNG